MAARGLARLIVAGTHSGVGKTTLTAGLLRALRDRGLAVQPFKAGPDYIDPTYHSLAAGRPCRNLDPWLLPPEALRGSLCLGSRDADLALVEGVMGLYDGCGYDSDTGSTAHLARLLAAPVVLVLDIAGMGRSAAALAKGYVGFGTDLPIAGFILNRAGTAGHAEGAAQAIRAATGRPCFGWLPGSEALNIPERHLGLVPTAEPGRWESFVETAARAAAAHLDLQGLVDVARQAPDLAEAGARSRGNWARLDDQTARALPQVAPDRVRIAVARDEAFSFYYADNLDLLAEAGAEPVFFSPLRDAQLPPGTVGLYLGGGFPEVYAAALADNQGLRRELRAAIAAGLPTYAECGGLMYLTRSISGLDGHTYPMVAALPGCSVMAPQLTMGYRLATVCSASFLAPPGQELRGHEFHYSAWVDRPEGWPAAYSVRVAPDAAPQPEGYAADTLLASYLHVHWLAAPELPRRFVAACQGAKVSQT